MVPSRKNEEMSSRAAMSRPKLRVVPSPPDGPEGERLPSPALDDTELLTAVRAADPAAAAALHDRLRPVVERAVRRLLGGADRDHEDLVQQAMIEVVFTIDRFRGECSLDGWAKTIASHTVFNHIRRRTTERRLFESLDGEDTPDVGVAREPTRDLATRSMLRRVAIHLRAIDDVKAWAYVLHDVCGHDLREVAQIMDSSVAAAQSRLVRGRRELRERMSADPELAPMLGGGES